MARVEINEVVFNSAGRPTAGASVTIYASNGSTRATWYTAESGGTSSTADAVTDSGGRIDAWVEQGTYWLAPRGGEAQQYQAVSAGSVAAASTFYTSERTTDYSLTSPQREIVHTGQFTPNAASVAVDIDISHNMYSFGSNILWELYYAQADAGGNFPAVLTPVLELDALAAGVVRKFLGSLGVFTGGAGGKLLLSGLVAGRAVKYELTAAVVGGYSAMKLPGPPFKLAVSNPTEAPDYAQYVAVKLTGPGATRELRVYRHRPLEQIAGFQMGSTLALPAAAAYGNVAITRYPVHASSIQKAAVVNNEDHSVTVAVIDGLLNTVTQQGKYTVPGTTPGPIGIDITPDGTYAWVSTLTTDRVFRMTMADGTFSAAIDPGALDPYGVRLSPDGAYAYVNCSGRVVKINTATLAVASFCTVTGVVTPEALAVTPDGTEIYVATNDSKLHRIRTSDMTIQASVATAGQVMQHLAIFRDGRAMWACRESAGNEPIHHFKLPSLARYVDVPIIGAGHDIAISYWGDIFITRNAYNMYHNWPGGEMLFDPIQLNTGHTLRIRAEGAT